MSLEVDARLNALLDKLLQAAGDRGRPLRLTIVLDRQTALTAGLLRRMDAARCELTLVRDAARSPDAVDGLLERDPAVSLVEFAFDDSPDQWPLDHHGVQDLVILDHVLPRLADTEAALGVLRACLKLDGELVVADRPPASWVDFVFGVAPSWWSAGFHPELPLGTLAAGDVEEALLAAGFAEPQLLDTPVETRESAPFVLVARSPEPGLGTESDERSPRTCVVIQDAAGFSALPRRHANACRPADAESSR
jgi:hypothetical protein